MHLSFASRTLICSLSVFGAAAALSEAVAGPIEVAFSGVDRYVDAGDSPSEVKDNLTTLKRHLERLGTDTLPKGSTLRVEFTDVDLAGRVQPALRLPQRVRVLDGAVDGPRLTLKYTFTTADGRSESGSEALTDPAYLVHPSASQGSSPLRYETRLLTQWVRTRFDVAGRAAK
jgi:hypothetical protein